MPNFFVPLIDNTDQEPAYQEMARLYGAGIPAPGDRVYSISWRHNGTLWTATVGEELRGVETVTKGRGRTRKEIEVPRSTSDTVLAIFPGLPFIIAHDNRSRVWNTPIYAGNPSSVVRFTS